MLFGKRIIHKKAVIPGPPVVCKKARVCPNPRVQTSSVFSNQAPVCTNCYVSKQGCDRRQPQCGNCLRRNLACDYGHPVPTGRPTANPARYRNRTRMVLQKNFIRGKVGVNPVRRKVTPAQHAALMGRLARSGHTAVGPVLAKKLTSTHAKSVAHRMNCGHKKSVPFRPVGGGGGGGGGDDFDYPPPPDFGGFSPLLPEREGAHGLLAAAYAPGGGALRYKKHAIAERSRKRVLRKKSLPVLRKRAYRVESISIEESDRDIDALIGYILDTNNEFDIDILFEAFQKQDPYHLMRVREAIEPLELHGNFIVRQRATSIVNALDQLGVGRLGWPLTYEA